MSNWLRRIKSFMNTDKEWHSFVNGFGIVAFPFLLLVRKIRIELARAIEGELHYFLFGCFLGVISLIGFVTAMIAILR
jgi:hypothetical protein